MAAKQLCESGMKVLILEAGTSPGVTDGSHDPSRLLSTHSIQGRCYAFDKNTSHYFVNDEANPYYSPSNPPFSWIRNRVVGGKTHLWAGFSYRMSDWDFKAPETDGFGDEWPISYNDIKPYYDKVEHLLRVRGAQTQPLSQVGRHLRESLRKIDRHLISARMSVAREDSDTKNPCPYCRGIGRNCRKAVSSPTSTLSDAFKTGRLTLLDNSPVRHIVTDSSGKARGVCAVRKDSMQLFEVKGRVIFLCASALESTRILLNSASSMCPQGLANSSGVLGRYLMDHLTGIRISGILHGKRGTETLNELSASELLYIPRWHNIGRDRTELFMRGYGYQVNLTRANHFLLNRVFHCGGSTSRPGTAPTRESYKFDDSIVVDLEPIGEMLPYFDNYVEIDKQGRVDSCGIPVLNIDCHHGANEKAQGKDMVSNAVEIVEEIGATITEVHSVLSEPGLCIHESGTCRMGRDPERAILNEFNQCHDVPNLYVTDGSSFPSQGTQNPTLTMMALTVRACEHAVTLLKRGEL
jgi:choline dehydrogenase-like flavoprotein